MSVAVRVIKYVLVIVGAVGVMVTVCVVPSQGVVTVAGGRVEVSVWAMVLYIAIIILGSIS